MGINLGDLITTLYEEFLELYGDEDLAAVATAASINSLLNEDPNEAEVLPTSTRGDAHVR